MRQLSGARALRAERLLAQHRAELDRDPRGDLVVRAEVVAIDITPDALAGAQKAQFVVLRTQELADLGVKITVLQTPEGMSATRGLKRLRKLDPEGTYDYNHVYLDSGEVAATAAATNAPAAAPASGNVAGHRVGLIDGGVDATHDALRGMRDPSVRLRRQARAQRARHRGGIADRGCRRGFQGAAPRAELFAADVYCGQPTGGAVECGRRRFRLDGARARRRHQREPRRTAQCAARARGERRSSDAAT